VQLHNDHSISVVSLFIPHDTNTVRYRWKVPDQRISEFWLLAKLSENSNKMIGFPDIVFNRMGIFPGCALGKMANWPYPVNEKCASRAFEHIHPDLKSYPI
jgi:hypothetical protein